MPHELPGFASADLLCSDMMLDPATNLEVETAASGLGFFALADSLSNLCRVSVYSDERFALTRFTIYFGKAMPISNGCRFFAWVFAANGIAIESKDGAEHGIVFKSRPRPTTERKDLQTIGPI